MLPIPGIVLGAYPERTAAPRDAAAAALNTLRALIPAPKPRRYAQFIEEVAAREATLAALDTAALEKRVQDTRAALARHGLRDDLIAESFALIKQTCARVLGIDLYSTQLLAARVMLGSRLAEMATGEGKTLAAGVCAATAALAGIPVHVVTANDYLVERDARTLGALYRALGLTVAPVVQQTAPAARRAAYDCDIVYCTASELVFDYLRDGLMRARTRGDLHQRAKALHAHDPASRGTLLRGLCMALIDEADCILIDDARVPLILSERCANGGEQRYFAAALEAAGRLEPGTHFTLVRESLSVELTGAGHDALEGSCSSEAWLNRLHRSETVCTALAALHLYDRDRHYIVRDGAVTIIDESTGRLAPGRVWSRGLHRFIELKENCASGTETATVAQITYQRFFQRYLSLCGMSGTLQEARTELASVYGLEVLRIPLRRPDRRSTGPTRLFPERESQWHAVVHEALAVSRAGRPVLIGTDSVAESEALSHRLAQVNQPHAVLNARQDNAEAEVIARAGTPGQITVATNMAGRGTDIELGPGVAERGGLHVICCQHNVSGRIDRQLVGRCARRGDPGSVQTMLALDKPLIARFVPLALARRVTAQGFTSPQWLVRGMVRWPQRVEERRQRIERRELLKRDAHAERALTFGTAKE
ncbi:MAG: prepilin peptidase [Betaproteobacteria bacterium]|nr:prepilin peptidase [Betaproteobacteria bacterium]